MISVGIYIDKDKNLIINSYREDENGVLRSLKQYIYLETGWSKEELADAIVYSLEMDLRDEEALIGEPDFWVRATGIKSFSAFSKRYKCIDVDYIDTKNCYNITAEKRNSDGSYGVDKDEFLLRQRTYSGYPKRETIADEVLEAMKIDENMPCTTNVI